MYKSVHGLVLREVPYKDSSRILTLLTQEEGRITADARGAKRKNSRLTAASQQLVWGEYTLFEKSGRYLITEASVTEEFTGLRADIGNLALAAYFASVLEEICPEGEPEPSLLRLGLNSLYALSRGMYPAAHIKAVFELRAACLTGVAPELQACPVCGRAAPERPRLSLLGGAVYCGPCLPPEEGPNQPLCPDSLAALRYVCAAPEKKEFSFALADSAAFARLSRAAERYLLAHTERGFSTLDYYKNLTELTP